MVAGRPIATAAPLRSRLPFPDIKATSSTADMLLDQTRGGVTARGLAISCPGLTCATPTAFGIWFDHSAPHDSANSPAPVVALRLAAPVGVNSWDLKRPRLLLVVALRLGGRGRHRDPETVTCPSQFTNHQSTIGIQFPGQTSGPP